MDFFHILRTIIRKMSGTPFKSPPERKNFFLKKEKCDENRLYGANDRNCIP